MGFKVVIATARSPRSVARILPAEFPVSPWVCYNGAEVYDGNSLLYGRYIDRELAFDIVSYILRTIPDITVSVESDGRLIVNRPLESDYPHMVASDGDTVDISTMCSKPVAKILFDADAVPDVKGLLSGLPSSCRVVVTSKPALGEIMHASVSKVSGMQVLLDLWGFCWEDVIAFGDEVHDLEMISASGLGVAMANAVTEVKSVARLVTSSNDEDGVAEVLEGILAGIHPEFRGTSL